MSSDTNFLKNKVLQSERRLKNAKEQYELYLQKYNIALKNENKK